MKKSITIDGMSCMNCVKHVKHALLEINGVSGVEVNLDEKTALVELGNVEDKALKAAIEDVGYDVVDIKEL